MDISGETEMWRNHEFKVYIILFISVSAIACGLCIYIHPASGVVCALALALILMMSVLFTRWRYRKIAELSQYLKRISAGEYTLDVRDNKEGELSILKNEIYKVTVTLYEQADMLKKDKQFLADSISNISHQLKTPLTSMFVMADLLQDENLPPNKRKEFTQNINTQLNRLQWLVTSLLKLSRIDAGAIEFRKENVNVKELVHRSVEHLLIPMELKEQTLEITGDENVHFIGDPNWSAEAVANIVKNCMEHTPCGGTISIHFSETPIHTVIEIADNGEGIDKADLPHIFNRFYKGKNALSDSIGIGLAMARSIIEKQGGLIDAESEKNKGTRFEIKFYKNIV